MPYYFAYGSNMSPHQMQRRCRGARPVDVARLDDWQFLITKRGTANIRPHQCASVYGVLWRLEGHHVYHLDRWEGVRWRNFMRRYATVTLPCGRRKTAIIYTSVRNLPGVPRTNYMLTALLPGAHAFNLPDAFIAELTTWLPRHPIGERKQRYIGRR